MNTVTIREYEHIYSKVTNGETEHSLKHHDFQALQSYCDYLEEKNNTRFFTLHKDSVQAKQYVGLIQLKSGSIVEILPKISKNNKIDEDKKLFLKMLFCLKEFKFKKSSAADLGVSRMPLYEIFILMYLDELQRLLKRGLKSDYISYTDNLHFYKGKLNIGGHIRYNAAHKERFYMTYDEFSLDRPENRIIKATLLYLQKRTKSQKNKKTIFQCLAMMESVTPSSVPEKDFAKITVSRNTKEYELLMLWSKVFLLGESFTTFSGNSNAMSLLFDMNKVFEAYVGKAVKNVFNEYNVTLQENSKYLFDKPKMFHLKPDIVVKDGDRNVAILDTKWKRIRSERDISQGDMYQMYAYAHRYNVPDIWLIYPKTEKDYSGAYKFTSTNKTENSFEVNIHIFFVDVGKINDSIKDLLVCIENNREQNQL